VAQKVQVTQVSDLSGLDGAETVRFSLDGTEYEIDLSAPEAEELRAGMEPYTGHARKMPVQRRRGGKRKPSRSDLPGIRAYARARGYNVKDRGAVPRRIVEEYDLLVS
jgi:nucleoid-associated protein Lsr2